MTAARPLSPEMIDRIRRETAFEIEHLAYPSLELEQTARLLATIDELRAERADSQQVVRDQRDLINSLRDELAELKRKETRP